MKRPGELSRPLSFESLFDARYEGADHLADSALHLTADAMFARDWREHVQILSRITPHLDSEREPDIGVRVTLFESSRESQKISDGSRDGTPFHVAVIFIELQGEALGQMPDNGNLSPDLPMRMSRAVEMYLLYSRHQLAEVVEVAQKNPNGLDVRSDCDKVADRCLNREH